DEPGASETACNPPPGRLRRTQIDRQRDAARPAGACRRARHDSLYPPRRNGGLRLAPPARLGKRYRFVLSADGAPSGERCVGPLRPGAVVSDSPLQTDRRECSVVLLGPDESERERRT